MRLLGAHSALMVTTVIALLVVVIGARAQNDDGPPVPAPARGSTGSACYEDCMWHYRNADNMVGAREAAYCGRPACYSKPRTPSASCMSSCGDAYRNCMAHSSDPSNDRTCPINQMTCQRSC